MQVDKLSQLQGHSSLQEVHLLELAEEDSKNHFLAVPTAPLTKSACSFFGMRQLKVLSMAHMDHVEVASCQRPGFSHCKHSEKHQAALAMSLPLLKFCVSVLLPLALSRHIALAFRNQ